MSTLAGLLIGALVACGVMPQPGDEQRLAAVAHTGRSTVDAFQEEFGARLLRAGVSFKRGAACVREQLAMRGECLLIPFSEPPAELCRVPGARSQLPACAAPARRRCVQDAGLERCMCVALTPPAAPPAPPPAP